ncbi:MAG: DNA-binding response regulator [Polynucleobacter sp. 17-46-58]|jgi:FixJ family two-component response regulator|nr:MAG: DNA-binding response regulator [Polynucleobacter sp. 35-46-207]OYZ38405.1 MAG: DNA-binding response regulator [Polynucleobacter sp. 16-46-70]OZA41608.1 MAG: DNA-binding response regulator [Polynucleobacter sp. 17-46-58]OZB46678.1 MAG: DNA-binding response regulator [Polynucleobacter sp. 39-45-136]HQR84993.1 response regulator [Polynucleobacter sp.]
MNVKQTIPSPLDSNLLTRTGVVYVIDDDEAVRDSLVLLLKANGLKVSPHESAERFLTSLESTDLQAPSCALIDIHLGGISGIELQEKLLGLNINIPIAFITGHGDVTTAVHALKKGACDFIQKPVKENALCDLISQMLSKAHSIQEQTTTLEQMNERFKLLTPRELDVLDRIVAGRINKQVGADLGISIKTVEAHRANIMEKLKVNRAANLVQVALKYQEAKAQRLI